MKDEDEEDPSGPKGNNGGREGDMMGRQGDRGYVANRGSKRRGNALSHTMFQRHNRIDSGR